MATATATAAAAAVLACTRRPSPAASGGQVGWRCSFPQRPISLCSSSSSSSRINAASELSFLCSQLAGIQLSNHSHVSPSTPLVAERSLSIVARRVCPFTGKKSNKANKVCFSNKKTIKRQFVNLQYKRIWWDAGNRFLKLRLSTKALKTIEKNGLDAVAKKAGIDLSKE